MTTATATTTPHNHDWYKRGKIIVLHIQHGQLYILFFAFLCYFFNFQIKRLFFHASLWAKLFSTKAASELMATSQAKEQITSKTENVFSAFI